MNVYDLINCLSSISDKEQELDFDDICKIIGLWKRARACGRKAEQLIEENIVSMDFIKGWFNEMHETEKEIRNYKAK